jgi:hypothetical protein
MCGSKAPGAITAQYEFESVTQQHGPVRDVSVHKRFEILPAACGFPSQRFDFDSK